MCKIFKNTTLILFIMTLFSGVCEAVQYTTLNDLVENGKQMNNKKITVKAEAIGESMKRGNFAWINVNDTTNSMGIWMKKEDSDKVKVFGDYKHKGDIIEISGIFNRACSEHGGDMDIHADDVKIMKKGFETVEIIHNDKKIVAGILSVIACILIGYYYMFAKE